MFTNRIKAINAEILQLNGNNIEYDSLFELFKDKKVSLLD